MSTYEEEDENDVPLTEDEIEELMVQVNRQVAKKLKQRDEQLLSLQKTMTGFMKSVRLLSTATNDAVKKRSPERQPQTNNYISPYKQQNLSPSKEKNQDKKKEYAYQSPYRQRSTHPPVVQISQRNDAFFSNDY